MMIRALDGTHDWVFGQGLQSFNFGANAIAEDIQTRLLSWVNDCFFDLDEGINWSKLLGEKNQSAQIATSCRAKILTTENVLRVNRLNFSVSGARALSISYNVDTVFTKNISQTVEVPV